MENLPSGWVWIIAILAPLIASLVINKTWDGRVKQGVAVLLSAALAVLVMWIDGDLATLPLGSLATVLGSVFGVAELMYKQVWAPLILDTPVEKQASVDLKQVLYVQKAIPLITATTIDLATESQVQPKIR
jgi:hypothetical protein